jgi:N-acetylglucosaminyl-diphospho-decaprenol L-rhamnosyltransferase
MSTTPDPDVAVVIVSYKSAELAIASIRSVEAERSAIRARVVVVDNASGDAPAISDAIAANGWSGWVTLVVSPRNGGFGYGNNLGIAHAFSAGAPSHIYLLNPDAQVRPGAIEALVRFFACHPQAGIAGSAIANADGSEWPIAFRFPSLLSEIDSGLGFAPVSRLLRPWAVARPMGKVAQQVDWVCGASMMIRPSVLEVIGGFDENYFLYFEETDFCHRARAAGFETWYVPESRVMHIRGQSTSVTDLAQGPKRLPAYWFESRRRYFGLTHGLGVSIAIDIAALIAGALGTSKQTLLCRRNLLTPHYLRDLLTSSVLWRRNRGLSPARTYIPREMSHGIREGNCVP